MAYGLKCWTGTGYVSFDTENMNSYTNIVASGAVTLAGSGSGSSVSISCPGYDVAYVFGPSAFSSESTYSLTKYSTSITIQNLTGDTCAFGYIAFKV